METTRAMDKTYTAKDGRSYTVKGLLRNQCGWCGQEHNTPEQEAACEHGAGPLIDHREADRRLP